LGLRPFLRKEKLVNRVPHGHVLRARHEIIRGFPAQRPEPGRLVKQLTNEDSLINQRPWLAYCVHKVAVLTYVHKARGNANTGNQIYRKSLGGQDTPRVVRLCGIQRPNLRGVKP
jgi:hypothetical protein